MHINTLAGEEAPSQSFEGGRDRKEDIERDILEIIHRGCILLYISISIILLFVYKLYAKSKISSELITQT